MLHPFGCALMILQRNGRNRDSRQMQKMRIEKVQKSLMKVKNISLKSTEIQLSQEVMNVGGKNILKNRRKVVFSDATFLLFCPVYERG